MNKIKMLIYEIRFFNIIAIALVFFAISCMITNQICADKWDTYVEKEKTLIDSVRMYKDASDYLTKKAFAYIDTEDPRYYRNYMTEAYEVKRKATAIYNIMTIGVGEDEESIIKEINDYSTDMMHMEEASMNLVRAEETYKAKEMLFSGEYEYKSNKIASNVDKIERLIRTDIKKNLTGLNFMLDLTFVCEVIIGILIIIVSPLRNKIITNLLYIDPLTNIENRVAFERYIGRYENEIKGMVFLDVNDLKTVNDTLGHKAGDELLLNTAKCIKKIFSRYGRCYRISGDEFIVVLRKEINEAKLLDEFNKECDEMSMNTGGKISVSCGFAMQDAGNRISNNLLYMEAEKNMYEAKTEYYKESGNDRRTAH